MKFSTFGSDPEKNNVANLPFDFNLNRKIPALNFQYPVSACNIEFGHKTFYWYSIFREYIFLYLFWNVQYNVTGNKTGQKVSHYSLW